NAAKSAADALNYRNQAQGIVGTNIGLGSSPRDCSDISGNPSGYIGFMRIMADATGFPSIASGESSLTGFISQVDGTPAYTGVFQGWTTRSLYTYRWSPTTGPQWTRHARKNEVDRLDQWNSETWLYNHDKSMRLGLTGSTWGCYSDTQKKWIPLDVSHGGTGANNLDDAKTNLQIPEGGLTKAMTINAPGGAVDGKYYPVIIDTSAMEGYGNLTCPIDIKTAGRSSSDPLNSNTFSGYFRCGGWSDSRDIACGSFVAYDKNELGILCLKVSQKDYPQYVAFYIHKAAFPILLQTGYKARVIVPTEDYIIGTSGVKYKFGVSTSTEGNAENAVKNALDFTGGESGFYSNLPFRQGYAYNVALTNGMVLDKNFVLTAPVFMNNGEVKATKSFTAYGTDVSNRTFVSQGLQSEGGPVVDQTELRAGNGQGEIVVRDINNSGNSKFFNFNLDGTFSSYQGLVVHTGQNWSTQHTENVNKFKPIAGSAGGPDGTMVVGGFHAQFSGNYVTQFAGRNSKFWARSFEAGVDKGWKRL
ncbi:prophage tail fiber N-terminal domain and S74 family endopeptidase-containing protein, partial [Escherichia coli]